MLILTGTMFVQVVIFFISTSLRFAIDRFVAVFFAAFKHVKLFSLSLIVSMWRNVDQVRKLLSEHVIREY